MASGPLHAGAADRGHPRGRAARLAALAFAAWLGCGAATRAAEPPQPAAPSQPRARPAAKAQPAFQAWPPPADDRGRVPRLDAPPRRIVSLVPSMTEAVCALGACGPLVGTDRWSDWPALVRVLPKLGGLDDAQIERIVALLRDVVLAAPSARVADRLEALGVPVVVMRSDTHADVRRTLDLLARLLGTPEAAPRLWDAVEAELRDAAARVPPALRGRRVYFEVSPAPHAAGAASFIGETLARLGMANAVPAALGPFPQLNPEYVLRAAPDIAMSSRRAVDAMPSRPGWDSLRALKEGRTCGFEPGRYEVLVRPGPRLGEAAQAIAGCLAGLGAAR